MIVIVGLMIMSVTLGCEKKENSVTKTSTQIATVPAPAVKQSYPKAPNFHLKDLSGKPVSLNDFAGKMVILNFWATWCGPCQAEIPDFVKLYHEYQKQGLVIVGIAVDQGGPAVVKQFVLENQVNYPILIYNMEVIEDYGGIDGIPTTFIINKNGEVVNKFIGYRDNSMFRDEVQRWLLNQ